MASNTRQNNLFALQDWKTLYTTFSDANFQSYDFETMRKVMVDYIRTYYAEDFNDFIESSEFVALLDLIAFNAQALAFRTDLNARENFLDTATRSDSVLKLIKQLGYSPNRNKSASGLLKITGISTTENMSDINGNAINDVYITWDDSGNQNWQNQFNQILNAAQGSGRVGRPYASKYINNILTQQYNISTPNSVLPIFSFSANLDTTSSPFEIVGANIATSDLITEQDPGTRGQFGMIYQDDGKGYGSSNTGYFLYFKQGTMLNNDVQISNKVPNRIINVNSDNINNEDIWFYDLQNGSIGDQWTKVPSLYNSSAIYSDLAKGVRNIYSVNSRQNDQVDLIFSDGTFGNMPYGTYRLYYRVSNGLTYRISPSNMSRVLITMPYVSKSNRVETLSILASLQYTVSNASRADSLTEIKNKAPQSFYSQDRMVNGEDYNSFPYTQYSDIVKSKAVNRFSIGSSRGIEINDPTGNYSSTNLFADDGVFYKDQKNKTQDFVFTNRNEVVDIYNKLLMASIASDGMRQFYYENYNSISFYTNIGGLLDQPYLFWQRTTNDNSSCTGYFVDNVGISQTVAEFSTSNTQYLLPNSLVLIRAPAGYYFDKDNVLIAGTPSITTDRMEFWTGVRNVVGDGTQVSYVAGRRVGAITLLDNIPTGAIVARVYAPWTTTMQNITANTIINLIFNHQEFALVYNRSFTSGFKDPWTIISIDNVNVPGDYDINTLGTSNDSSWLVLFQTDGTRYTMTYRVCELVFGSKKQISFLNINPVPVFDSSTNKLMYDNIRVLANNTGLAAPVDLRISDNIRENDGFSDSSRIMVTYAKRANDTLPSDPDIFRKVVTGTTVFYKSYTDSDSLVRYQLLDTGEVINASNYSTFNQIQLARNGFPIGKLFYAVTDRRFYQVVSVNNVPTVKDVTSQYSAYSGRQLVNFQYQHNANNDRRLDPAASNLIDLFIITRSYDEQYRNYVADQTNTLMRPAELDTVTLNNSYGGLFRNKMISDELVINPGKYKLLFGGKATLSLQAKFYVVKNTNTSISDNELKSRIVDHIQDYFALENWDFGETFYFSELSAYLHSKLPGLLNSIIIAPQDTNSVFGSLYEIRCLPNEIFLSAATVDNIEITTGVLSGINSAGLALTNQR